MFGVHRNVITGSTPASHVGVGVLSYSEMESAARVVSADSLGGRPGGGGTGGSNPGLVVGVELETPTPTRA